MLRARIREAASLPIRSFPLSNSSRRSIGFISSLVFAASVLACTGSGDDPAPGPGTGPDGASPGGGGGQQQGACTEDALFPPALFGEEGNDVVRRIEVDPRTGDVLFSTWQEIYQIPDGSDVPVQLLARPADAQPIYGAFWLRDTELLLPAASGVAAIITAVTPGATTDIIPVLYSAPRAGGTPTLQVSAPAPPEEMVFYEIRGARVVGDDVFWVDAKVRRESFATGAPLTRTYRARRASWRSPAAEPTELYTSERALNVPVVVGGIAYIDERNNERADGGSVQRMIHLDDGRVDATSADERFGGKVRAGDASSLIISSSDFGAVLSSEVARVALDGSGREPLIDIGGIQDYRSKDGVWGYTKYDAEAGVHQVYAYEAGAAPRRLGCVGSARASIHDVVIGDGELLVSVAYDDFTTTILRYPL
jgi:hypothetical protein